MGGWSPLKSGWPHYWKNLETWKNLERGTFWAKNLERAILASETWKNLEKGIFGRFFPLNLSKMLNYERLC